MVARGAKPALVVDDGRLIGLLGTHDVLGAVAERVRPSDARAREWMSEVRATVTADASLDEAAAAMVARPGDAQRGPSRAGSDEARRP